MNEPKRCTRCILSANFPKIEFDQEGVCSVCRGELASSSQVKIVKRSKKQVESLFEESKGKSEYDAIMCFSGGKDSTYTLKLAVEKYGLRVLAFTLDNGFISDTAFENINRVVDYLGVDLISYRPSVKFLKSVIKACAFEEIYPAKTLTRISSGCNACISMINITALKIALEKNIPLILAGFTLGQIPANAIVYKNHYRFFQESREPSLQKLTASVGQKVDSYYRIKDEVINNVENYPHNVNLLCIENIGEDQIVEEVKKIGWIPPKDVDGCSSNCRLNVFNNYVHQQTFGYSPYELELSCLVREDQLTRDQALEKIFDQSEDQLQWVCKNLDVTLEDVNNLKNKDYSY